MVNRSILEQLEAIVIEQGWSLRIKKCWGKEYVFAVKGSRRAKEQEYLGLLENLEGTNALGRARRLSEPPVVIDYTFYERYIFFRNDGSAKPASWRKALIKMFSDACMRCGWNLAPCDAHHILPKSQGGTQTLENGVLLCPNCHRLAHLGQISSEELRHLRDTTPPQREHWQYLDIVAEEGDENGDDAHLPSTSASLQDR